MPRWSFRTHGSTNYEPYDRPEGLLGPVVAWIWKMWSGSSLTSVGEVGLDTEHPVIPEQEAADNSRLRQSGMSIFRQ